MARKELDLSDLSKYSTIEAESYDEAMDSLTRSQRNKLLDKVTERTSVQLRGVGFWRGLLGLVIKGTGLMLHWYGRLITYLGDLVQGVGDNLLRPK